MSTCDGGEWPTPPDVYEFKSKHVSQSSQSNHLACLLVARRRRNDDDNCTGIEVASDLTCGTS